jgi:inosine-uridine nucleoside N-ribohydrolase
MEQRESFRKIPVILDTDIGADIDDTWALVMMINSPELDIKMILTETGNTTYRAKIVAKLLEIAGRTDIPIGVGLHTSDKIDAQGPWVEDYDLGMYSGKVYMDGIDALIEIIMKSEEQITLISIGPVTNIANALEKQPEIAHKARFVGMQGNIRKGYRGLDKIVAECNVVTDPNACQKVFTAPWDITITPLDTCGLVKLKGENYLKVHNSHIPIVRALMENYRIWNENYEFGKPSEGYGVASTILYDTVAIYLAFREELLCMEELGIRVTDDGYTLMDENAKKMNCATTWKDIEAFEVFLIQRLIG